MWVTSLGLAGEAGIFASLPFYPMFSGVPNGPLRLSPPQVHAAVHNSGFRNCYADPQFATEFGAYGIAVLLIERLTDLTVFERSRKGPGFDYWLAPKGSSQPLFQDKSRLEVSGILSGDEVDLKRRMRQKLVQLERGGVALPGYGVVVHFAAPESRVAVP